MTTMTPKPLSYVDLFAGAGGLSLGFLRSGFYSLLALDHDAEAVSTYARNIGPHVQQTEIDEDIDLPQASIIIGGPPCQGFSSAGLRRHGDNRNSLVGTFAELVAKYRPLAFVFENVEGFLTAEKGARVIDLLDPLINAGYLIHLRKVNVANYGVPQHRKRVIVIGGLGWTPTFPEPTHFAHGAPGSSLVGRGLMVTASVSDALDKLPPAVPNGVNGSQDHSYRPLSEEKLGIVKLLKPGQTMRGLPEEYWHSSYKRRAYRRVMDGTPSERRGGPPAGLRRLRGDEPSKAITGGASTELIHPSEDRMLTIRECARIQTFPDEFKFDGVAVKQATLVGNAVPPRFAEALASNLKHDMAKAIPSDREGRLLSFSPTHSKGLSPALKELANNVLSRYPVESIQKIMEFK